MHISNKSINFASYLNQICLIKKTKRIMVNLLSNFGLALMIVATIGFIALICGIIIEKSSLSNKFMNLFNDAKEKRF